jgi:predicted ATPase
MAGVPSVIRTPDQRIRVFVSSTLRELADERRAVRAGIERMRLAPVMFELGARPHPPRELYRSYLAQSDIFIGIYADSYGWVAPGEAVSGLEDEYNLAPSSMPKLIYIRESKSRDERLGKLIARIQSDDNASYLTFTDAADLTDRVQEDLATLLAERFDESRFTPTEDSPDARPPFARLPSTFTTTIGRAQDVARVRTRLQRDENHVVTLLGAGGIGKSRLAIEVAHTADDLFPDGVYFVPLEGVHEAGLLLPTIAYVLGVRDNGEANLEDRIMRALEGRRVLIVLDDFEQIVDAAPTLVRFYTAAPLARFLVTSRVVLRIRGEQVYEVESLAPPGGSGPTSLEQARRSPAVALFVDRAQSVNPAFALTAENASAVSDICRRLDGLPLAIELAAAQTRVLTPEYIAQRLDHSLSVLTVSTRDMPTRHRTMRATIEWSVSLLSTEQRALLEDLGVFAAHFTLEAVEAISSGRPWEGHAIDALSELVDASLVTSTEFDGRSTFSLLTLMREYATDSLEGRGELDALCGAHADYYVDLVRRVAPGLRGVGQAAAVKQLGLELPNLRAAVRHLIDTDRLDDAGEFAWTLFVYWWISGFLSEVRLWMLELLDKQQPISKHTRAVAQFFAMWSEMWQHPSAQVVAGLGESVRLFDESGDEDAAAIALAGKGTARLQFADVDAEAAEAELTEAVAKFQQLGDRWSESMAEVGLGWVDVVRGRMDGALAHFSRSAEIADQQQDLYTRAVAGNNRTRVLFLTGDIEAAEQEWYLTLQLSIRLHYEEGITFALDGLAAIAATRGDAWRAGAFSKVASDARQRTGMLDIEGLAVHLAALAALRETDPEGIAAGERAGAAMTLAEAVALAMPDAETNLKEAMAAW